MTPTPVVSSTQSTCRIDATVAFHDLASWWGWRKARCRRRRGSSRSRRSTPGRCPSVAGRRAGHGDRLHEDEILSLRGALRTSDDLSEGTPERSLPVTLTFAGIERPPIIPTHVVPPAARSFIFDFADGTPTQRSETAEVILSAAPLSVDSTCRTDAIVEISEAGGAPLVVQASQLSAASPSAVVEWSETSSALPRRGADLARAGVAGGCTMAEFGRLRVSLATYETATGRTLRLRRGAPAARIRSV